MAKEPWQEDIYENQEETRSERRKRTQGRDVVANRVLTILASIFFVIVVVMIIVLIYLSSGGSNRTVALKDFHDSDANVVQISSSSSSEQASSSSEDKEESSSNSEHSTDPEGTTKVLAGEGEAAIAARAGISIAQLEALNPGHMATGSWFANPGDVVKIK
ncbi:SAG1386/EF1546 family surface-associated protein [Streptococcus mitis]|uniref:SAG1386/EF1546 family surface-associated protein n=1 Tax=Streptococcus mitis TaxID=28037 RepID=UPI00031BADCF|nr:SAG1386/EF1546 family surface-associated protein [Streptococcus mitis]